MKIDRKALLAIAIGWFVIVDILLRTTEGTVGYVDSTASNLRSIVYAIRGDQLTIDLDIIGLATLVLLSLLTLAYLWRAWTCLIAITRVVVKFFFYDSATEIEDELTIGKNMRDALFGENVLKNRNALFWRFLFSLLTIWLLLLMISIIAGTLNSFLRY